MKRIVTNAEQLKEFGTKTKNECDNLVKILENMKKDSILYQDMVDNKAGNLYKEVMLREIDKEIKRVNETGTSVSEKIIFASNEYNKFKEEVGEKVNGSRRDDKYSN